MDDLGYPVCKEAYAQKLYEKLNQKPAFVVSATYCSYCNKAKALLNRQGIEHTEIMLDELNREDQIEYSNCLYGTGQRFVPLIFLKGQMIGGFGELQKLHQDGTLQKDYPKITPVQT